MQSPCSFTCADGYTPSPSTNPTNCVCKAPYTECNGVCGQFPHGCGSQGLSRRKRDQSTCPAGKTMCGVPNGGKGYDCVDIKTDSESCKCFRSGRACILCGTEDMSLGGGCTVASPFGNNVADGKNCKSIPHVDKVQCDNGSCLVLSCKDGYNVSRSYDSCIQPRLERVRQVRSGDIIDVVLNLLFREGLLVAGLDLVSVRQKLVVIVKVLDGDHVLQALLDLKLIVGFNDLVKLKARLGADLAL